jgi:hypothetical protein
LVKEFKEKGCISSEYDTSNCKAKKIEKAELIEFAKTHSDAFLSVYSDHFNCSATAVFMAFKRYKIALHADFLHIHVHKIYRFLFRQHNKCHFS